MLKCNWYCYFLVLYSWNVNADLIIDEFKNEKNLCINVCTDSFFLLPVVKDAGNMCERGCRFFNIIYLTYGQDINNTKQQCYSSCKEAYDVVNEDTACITGCNVMSKKKEVELTSLLAFIEQDSTKNFLLETEIEILESDILSNPAMKNQIQVGYNFEYKIPETKIRTMPIAEIIESRILESKSQASGDWLDCASRNSGIPKTILLTAILLATIVVLILLISSARDRALESLMDEMHKTDKDMNDMYVENVDEKKDNLSYTEEKCDDYAKLIENEINFSEPPKYQSETEKV